MKQIKLNFFELGTLFWITTSFIVLFFSFIGIFNIYSIILAILVSLVIPIQFYRQGELKIERIHSKNFKLLIFIIFILGVYLSISTTPTIFGGRDEGSYSNAAIMMVNDGHRSHDSNLIKNFSDIYGESKALNFPGFQYNSENRLESQFLPGYSNWLAIFYQLFKLNGLKFANLLPFMTFLLSFYLIIVEVFPLIKKNSFESNKLSDKGFFRKYWLKLTQAEQSAWIGTIFLMTFMPLLVFYKLTLSEIYFASLAWFSTYLLIRYLKDKRFLKFKVLFIPLLLMLFIRVETVAIIFALLLIMIGKDFSHLKQARYQFFFALSGFMLLIIVWLEPNFFINAAKGISEISGLNANAIPESRESTLMGKMIPDDWKNFYVIKIWFTYGLLPFFMMSGTFLLLFFKSVFKNRKFGDKNALIIIPFLLFSPTLIYLIDSNISLDHPWMLRRLIFSIVPIIFLYSTFFLFYLKQENRLLYRMLTAFVIVSNITLISTPLVNFINFSQNQGLLKQTEEISKLFGENDLVLLSQKSSGSGWSMLAEPMRNIFSKQAVYFFNAKNYAELNHDDFDNIFLISTEEESFLYENIKKEKIGKRIIENTIINPSRNPLAKTTISKTNTEIILYRIYQ